MSYEELERMLFTSIQMNLEIIGHYNDLCDYGAKSQQSI
jgi:hypothetical protein